MPSRFPTTRVRGSPGAKAAASIGPRPETDCAAGPPPNPAVFHSRSVPSSPPVASSVPSALKESASTAAGLGATRPAGVHEFASRSHSSTVPSACPAAIRRPSGLVATA
ncbi:hypothetical protein KGA66_19010 [Actinocrinis puniceicyclus]|uniref:Uncharacterized protein n=1 Tax=Actinocrinis puniceicyclus TaxID=977794 RepID=A0A8J7WU11_9ACTN|nr:hypothetical protein [Actinocrinis puniceicyclus]MBS2965149.1 hypothetical protein [Actinocrinis puniceicyclus]